MRQLKKLMILAVPILLSACLQESAPIEGINNYTMTSSKYNQRQNSTINQESAIFEDENLPAPVINNQWDPYQNPVNNPSDDVNFGILENLPSNEKEKVKAKDEIDWDAALKPNIKTKEENVIIKKSDLNQSDIKNKKPITEKKEKISIPTSSKIGLMAKPVHGKIISKYGKTADNDLDEGITFKMSDKNIMAAADGRVIYVDDASSSNKNIIIKHSNGTVASYSYNGIAKVVTDKEVKAGQVIGQISPGGRDILYFTVRKDGKIINPETILK